MSDQDIFNKEKNVVVPEANQAPVTPAPIPAPVVDTSEDLLRMITNEAGEPKYSSVKDALVGLSNAQTHIPMVEADNTALRDQLTAAQVELDKKNAALEALDRFAQKQDTGDNLPVTPAVIDEGAVADLVNQALSQRETATKQSANLKEVTTSLREKYGDKAGEIFYSKAGELGLSREEINTLASSSPKAALQLFGVIESSNVKPNVSSINSDGFISAPTPPSGYIAPSTKSIMAGATSKELADEMRRHKEAVYAKHGITG